MFENFDPNLFSDPNFKEDSVREVIIAPMLSKLGYYPSGEHTVIRSKTLVHPFIYVGTRSLPVKLIPDYTLCSNGRPTLVLDAKSPSACITSRENVQQVYSYAIHPDVHVNHFALCNGKRLVIYSTQISEPLLDISYEEYESRWEEIEKHLLPKYLQQPEIREFAPDFGFAVTRLGLKPSAKLTLFKTKLGLFVQVSNTLFSATVDLEFAGQDYCASFDFTPEQLPLLISGLPPVLQERFSQALLQAPFQASADLCVEVDLQAHLGEAVEVEHETFIPLIIDKVIDSRFNPYAPLGDDDIPAHIFRLSKAFQLATKDEQYTDA